MLSPVKRFSQIYVQLQTKTFSSFPVQSGRHAKNEFIFGSDYTEK